MLRSMTGYGQHSAIIGSVTVTADVKSVNHRFLDIVVKLPKEWTALEDKFRRILQRRLGRGRVELAVTVERSVGAAKQAAVDWDLAEAYVQAAKQLAERFGLSPEAPLRAAELLAVPGIFSVREIDWPPDAEKRLTDCVECAVDRLILMREAEGRFLTEDARKKLSEIGAIIAGMKQMSTTAVIEYRDKLQERIRQLLGGAAPVDGDRLAAEIAIFAERTSIDEELTRLESHAVQLAALLEAEEPVGRRMDFLLQEMNREANTIGSKAGHAMLSQAVVLLKSEIEKLREQAQNVE